MNIGFHLITRLLKQIIRPYFGTIMLIGATIVAAAFHSRLTHAEELVLEPVQACVIARNTPLTAAVRSQLAQCLGWQTDSSSLLCGGSYHNPAIDPVSNNELRIMADEVSFYHAGRSELQGNVEVQQEGRVVNAQTAYVFRDAKTNKVTGIELLGEVRYLETDRMMIARKVHLNPQDNSGRVEDVLYRFNYQKHAAVLPAWGQAKAIERFANKDMRLQQATYTTCAPQDDAWHIEAADIKLDYAKEVGVARQAKLYLRNQPILYMPYLSFSTSKKRKSGFLMPVVGSSNVGGFDLALPYYWNIAPNYDATLTPHFYSKRGILWGGQFRYLTAHSFGTFNGRFIAHDRAFHSFLRDHADLYTAMADKSSSRYSLELQNSTLLNPDLHLGLHLEQVSDDYFLQDFSTNLAVATEKQLLRQGDLTYTTDHWFYRGMVQSYQTLHPIEETHIEDAYQRLPQLKAFGKYDELPFDSSFSFLGQYDNFKWPGQIQRADGARYHLNPIFSLPQMKPWGYITPSVELVENYYGIRNQGYGLFWNNNSQYNRTIPRYYLDGGLYFERSVYYLNQAWTQTLEPHLFYLYVPYHDQTPIPVFDSGYMIFNYDQVFRTNRFSGFDRIGDANQLSYGLSSRWLSERSGAEKASLALGQIRYFSRRRVQLCQSLTGYCLDNPLQLGNLPPDATYSPVVGRGNYHFNPFWGATGDYAWDPNTRSTNNGHLNIHYQSGINKIIALGYTYLVNGDITQVGYLNLDKNPLHQATFAYAWPFNAKWSTLGAYNYNISKRYEMMSLLGVQYDNCCWAVRLVGGRTFRDLDTLSSGPRYNNNIYLQVLLKGLGSAGNSDPVTRLRTFISGYHDIFHN